MIRNVRRHGMASNIHVPKLPEVIVRSVPNNIHHNINGIDCNKPPAIIIRNATMLHSLVRNIRVTGRMLSNLSNL